MARSVFLFTIFCLCTCLVESREEGYVIGEISNKGLDFLKNLLIIKAESSLVPLELPNIEKSVHIPLLGNVDIVLSSIVIQTINLTSSTVKIGDNGTVINVSGATANLIMNWKYSYRAKLLPISVSDQGNATVQVDEMDIGLTVGLKTVEGSLVLSLLEFGCYVNDLSIKLNGGASWLYQGLVDAFGDKIESAVEDAISRKLSDGIVTLDSLFLSLPKQVHVTKTAALNVTFVDDPKLSESSIDIEINGLFSPDHETALYSNYRRLSKAPHSCERTDKMLKISVHENVLKSASSVYFQENKMHWTVENAPGPNKKFLNTTWWRFVVPQLYKTYPDHTMILNFSVSSLPTIEVKSQQIKAKAPVNVVINVLDDKEVIPVACFSVVIGVSASAEITGNSVSGNCKLIDFDLSLNWSNIGDLHISVLQTLASTTMRTVIIPYINLKFYEGFKIPGFKGYGVEAAEIVCRESWIVMCSDVAPLSSRSHLISVS